MQRTSPNGRLHLPTQPLLTARRPGGDRRKKRVRAARPVRAKEPETPAITALRVVAHSDGWALMVDELDTPAWVVRKKRTAVASAKDAATYHQCMLQVLTRAGKVQNDFDFRPTGATR